MKTRTAWMATGLALLLGICGTSCSDSDDDAPATVIRVTNETGQVTTVLVQEEADTPAGGQEEADTPAAESDQSQLPLQAPTLNFPVSGWRYPSGKGGEQVQLIWNPAQGAQSYIARIWRTDRTSDVQDFDVGSKTMHTVATRIGEYQWQVAAVRGSEKKWSESRKFTIVD